MLLRSNKVVYLLPFVYEPHRDPFLDPSDNNSSNPVATSDTASIILEQPPVRTHIYGTPHLHKRVAQNPISNKYHNTSKMNLINGHLVLTRRSIICRTGASSTGREQLLSTSFSEHLSIPTISNFTSSHTLFTMLYELSDVMGIDTSESGKVSYNHWATP